MPRCTRCSAPVSQDDATAPDPQGGGMPGHPGEPLPPPWSSPQQPPAQWGASLDQPPPGPAPDEYTTPMPPSGETFTQLSPEPWAEPAIWQPPAPPKKSRAPYFLAAAGAVLLLGLALGIVFWPSGSDSPAQSTGGVPSAQGQEPAPTTEETGEGGDVEGQAKEVDDLLEEMGGTRSELGGVVTAGCPASGMQRILDARQTQLAKARALDVSALDNGPEMKAALIRALEASTESNQRYLDVAPGCPAESEVADVNQRASSAKSEFLGYWSPIAGETGLPSRGESDI
ncbi:hypothetical protein [Actinomadura livida]|uniref:Uncharacterized protein n=3 Tax=Actinomadura livida TaxID=79909 RepID=A0A7W7I9E5_9ACTN|nr:MULTISPECIES: hypothetical protein [Actinomadura]MBB4772840.1 hypothetical protein [Actinomadura catellatispora]